MFNIKKRGNQRGSSGNCPFPGSRNIERAELKLAINAEKVDELRVSDTGLIELILNEFVGRVVVINVREVVVRGDLLQYTGSSEDTQRNHLSATACDPRPRFWRSGSQLGAEGRRCKSRG